jgi:hypothetical protein
MALSSSATAQSASEIIHDRAEVRDQLRLLVVNLSDELLIMSPSLAATARRQRREMPKVITAQAATETNRSGRAGHLPRYVTDRIIELMATPAPDPIAQIDVPTSLRTNGTLKPRALTAERVVPAQPDEHSVDRDAAAFPANPQRMARAWAAHGIDRDLGARALDEAADLEEPKHVQARNALDDAITGKVGGVRIVTKAEATNHGSERNARRRRQSRASLPLAGDAGSCG